MLDYDQIKKAIQALKIDLFKQNEVAQIFGIDREGGLNSILKNIELTFHEQPLYKSAEEKAAHLFYFVIKDHPFIDGNKRIGCFLFLIYLKLQNINMRINDNGLIALALLIAESDPKQKDIVVKLVINLLIDG